LKFWGDNCNAKICSWICLSSSSTKSLGLYGEKWCSAVCSSFQVEENWSVWDHILNSRRRKSSSCTPQESGKEKKITAKENDERSRSAKSKRWDCTVGRREQKKN
jgi:hypothetical protein